MRALGRIAVGLFAFLLLALLLAWVVPPMLDWDRYRTEIAAIASRELGRPVHIDGFVALRLLPEPMLVASHVGLDPGGDGVSASVAQLRVGVAFGPLLAGRIDARELAMNGLDLRLPWPLPMEGTRLRTPAWLTALSADIEDSRLAIGDLVVTGINATVSSGALTGALQAVGRASLSSRSWRFTARLTQPGGDGAAGVDVTLDGQGAAQDVGMALAGQLAGDGTFAGRLTARGPDLSQLLPAPRVPFRADGRVTVAGGLAAADDLTVEINGSPARGAVALRLMPTPRLDVALAASRIDLDAWLPTLLDGAPPTLPLGIDLSAEAADLSGGILRRLRGAFDLAGGEIAVREFSAVLPGDGALTLAGRILRPPNGPVRQASAPRIGPVFSGNAHLAAPDLRPAIAWLAHSGLAPLTAFPNGVLRSADVTAAVTLQHGQIAVGGLTGAIDGAHVNGTLAASFGDRLAISADLHADRVDLDPWLPAAVPLPAAVQAGLAAFDADIKLDLASAVLHGVALTPLTLDAVAHRGNVTLRHLSLSAGDVTVAGAGQLIDGRIEGARLTLNAGQANEIIGLLPPWLAHALASAPPLARSPLGVDVLAAGTADALGVRALVKLGDLRIEAQPTIDVTHQIWGGPLTLRHPGAPRLAEDMGLIGAPAWLGDGSMACIATVAVTPTRFSVENFDLTAGSLHATGRVALDRSGAVPEISGRVAADTLPLPLPYPRSPEPFDLHWLGDVQATVALQAGEVLIGGSSAMKSVTASVALRDGTLHIDKVDARVGGGDLTGALAVSGRDEPPSVTIEANLHGATVAAPVFDLPLDLSAGVVDASATLRAAGHSFATLLATSSGDISVTVRNGALVGFSLGRLDAGYSDGAIAAAIRGGVTGFDRLTITAGLQRGIATLDTAEMTSADGSAAATGTIDLPNGAAALDVRMKLHDVGSPDVGARLTGPFVALQRVPETADVTRWRLQHGLLAGDDQPPAATIR